MRRVIFVVAALLLATPVARGAMPQTLGLPAAGDYYHGVYPGGITGEEDDITATDVADYVGAAGRDVAWVYFSDNWYKDKLFPTDTVTWIRDVRGSVPFIRLMLRGNANNKQGPFSLKAINGGRFDDALMAWGAAARAYADPLIVEFGTEVNGSWFPWNGTHNGGPGTGPNRFIRAYRHIVDTIAADNITWVFHVNWDSQPAKHWNDFEKYYPGDDYVDWLGVSVYGALTPVQHYDWPTLREGLDSAYERLVAMAPTKPVFLLEFGMTTNAPHGASAGDWADAALDDILGNRWPALRGFSWWNETWQNDNHVAHDTDMRIQDDTGLSSTFAAHLHNNTHAIDRPIFGP